MEYEFAFPYKNDDLGDSLWELGKPYQIAFLVGPSQEFKGISRDTWMSDQIYVRLGSPSRQSIYRPEYLVRSSKTRAHDHSHPAGAHHGVNHPETMPPRSSLEDPEGASVSIVSPVEGQVFEGDEVPLQFKLSKGKRGEHVHAYVDGVLMGMFKTENGTLTGIERGHHTLEVRVVTEDHNVELDATDTVPFVVK